jgi:hypothetical protein
MPVVHLHGNAAGLPAPIVVGQEGDLRAPSDALFDLGVEVREAAPEAREVLLQSADSFVCPVEIVPMWLSVLISGATRSNVAA